MKKSLCMATNIYRSCFTLIFIFLMPLFFSTGNLIAQKIKDKEFSGGEAAKIVAGASYVKERRGTPFPAFVRLEPSARISIGQFIPWLKQTVKSDDDMGFRLLKQETDELGFTHYRYEQTFLQIPVDNTFYHVHIKNNVVSSFNGFAVNITAKLSAKPAQNEGQALKAALRKVGATKYKWEVPFLENDLKKTAKNAAATYFPKGLLYWVNRDGNYRLAYRFDIHSATPDKIQRVYIDAQTGAPLFTLPLESNCTSATVNTIFNGNRTIFTDKFTATNWRLRDNCQAANIRVRDWNSANCTEVPLDIENATNTWTTMNERFGGTVLWSAKESFLYWRDARGRNGYNNANGNVDAYINAVFDGDDAAGCQAYTDNASMSFTGGRMKVGLGSAGTLANSWSSLDIIAHEFTHAVTGSSAALVYENESGALNESFSDIFGEAIENYSLGSNDWLVGDDRTNGAIRSLSNPSASPYNDPDTYLGTNWKTGTGDNGGVHSNSGVQNFWFYLLVQGGSGTNDNSDAYSVSGIGLGAASAIASRNLITYLGTGSGYSDARTNAIQAAIDLYGACSNEVKQTTNAWYAVGVGDAFFDAAAVVTSNYNGRAVSCFNACDGSATVNVTSGVFPTYSWSTGATTQSVSNLCPGTYTVTVTNALGLGCAVTKSVTIANTPLLVIAPAVTSNYNGYGVACFGDNNGVAAANASGGTPPYTYNWSNGQSTATATGLSAGSYSVTVTDANGCSKFGNVTVTQPPLLTTSAAPTSNYNGYNVRCNGGSDGTATTTPVGGVAPYTYLWSNGQTTQNATGLMAISYTVTVTDANGCTASANTTLTEPPVLTINAGPNKIVYLGYPDSSCTNLTATGAGGGVPPYTLTWSTGSNNATINVCPSVTTVYTITITDANGCSITDDVTVCVIDVRCGNKLDKVTICHRTNSAKNPFETLCLDLHAAKNHFLTHPEDQLAACGTVKICNDAAPLVRNGRAVEPLLNGKAFIKAYPNPLSGAGIIKFMVSSEDRGALKVYDITGKEVANLFEGRIEANVMYDVNINGTPLSKGVYLVKLNTQNGQNEIVKLLIAR